MHRTIVAFAALALLATVAAHAAGSSFKTGDGSRVYAAVDHFEKTGKVGCVVYVRWFEPAHGDQPQLEVVKPILIRGADAVACSAIYHVGRKITVWGHMTNGLDEGDFFTGGRRGAKGIVAVYGKR
jgi:hypothetical protein